jgi:hypothetical protein
MIIMTKGSKPKNAKYACGGPEITTKSRFLKTPNSFTTGIAENDAYDGKDPLADSEGETKSLKAIKPHT